MIPLRVKLRGFLSYRDEQSLDFTEAPLWMLAGPNGSGKSAVFDAVTYALFGSHRGGSRDADELINKQSDGFAIEFEFALGEASYLIRRTLKRTTRGGTATTQQILRRDCDSDKWNPISETNKKTAFNEWIQNNIGLRFPTFAASVLLVQGQAERLLSQTPADRFKVLADVVDLDRYIRLHARVEDRRKELKSELEVLRNQLIGMPVVTAEQLTAVRDREKDEESVQSKAAEVLESLRALALSAQRWEDLQRRMAELHQRRTRSEQIIGRSAEIEKDAARLRELNGVIPLAEKLVTARGGVATAQRNQEDLARQAASANEKLNALTGTIDQLSRQRESLLQDAEKDDTTRIKLADDLKSLAVIVAQLDTLERHQRELADHETKFQGIPADLAERLANAQLQVEDLSALNRSLSTLQRLRTARNELRERIRQQVELDLQLKIIHSEGETINGEIARLQKSLVECDQTLSASQDAAASAKTLLQQAQIALDSLGTLGEEPNCRLCGQALTVEHRAIEQKRRTDELDAAIRQSQRADKAHLAVKVAHQAANAEADKTKAARDAKRDEYRNAKHKLEQSTLDVQRLQQSLSECYDELPADLAAQVSPQKPGEWCAKTYPTEDDLAGIRERIGDLPAQKKALGDWQVQQRQADVVRGAIESARRMVTSLAIPSKEDPSAIRGRHTRSTAELAALDDRIQKRRADRTTLQTEHSRADQELEKARRANEDLQQRLNEERTKLQLAQQTVQSALAALPKSWRDVVANAGLADQSAWKDERIQLEQAGVEQKASELETIRASLSLLTEQESKLAEETAAVPDAQRVAVADIEQRIRDSKATVSAADTAHRQAHEERVRVENLHQQREELADRLRSVDADHELHGQLAELLGRDRLQSHLVRRAERQIVEQANAVLDRLSGGELHLRLRGSIEDQESAFDMEAVNRATGMDPIGVAFLSGSQRFRVAVSLALGIGRFASGQHRPIESVIIDEGFGCLDRSGRQVMIQELQNLRGFLKRILLVSHQEEFADAFRDGYRFELVNGATQVTRFQR